MEPQPCKLSWLRLCMVPGTMAGCHAAEIYSCCRYLGSARDNLILSAVERGMSPLSQISTASSNPPCLGRVRAETKAEKWMSSVVLNITCSYPSKLLLLADLCKTSDVYASCIIIATKVFGEVKHRAQIKHRVLISGAKCLEMDSILSG
jgi:hypothetical protein